MFSGLDYNARLLERIDEFGLNVVEDFSTISSSLVVIHNPSLFRFESSLRFRIVADTVILVMHENPVNAVGQFQYDVAGVIGMIRKASFCNDFVLAPVSPINRGLMEQAIAGYRIAARDWFNIIDVDCVEPKPPQADRRGRHSRPGPEKWPGEETMLKCFPSHSENHILGADWVRKAYPKLAAQANLYDFGAVPVELFLNKLDFFVYYHAPAWRESFGRVLAEAIAAGKVVICERYLAETFGEACVAIDVDEIDDTVNEFLDRPISYVDHVTAAQNYIGKFARSKFEDDWSGVLDGDSVSCV
jgi:hypothetical protein